MMKNEMKVMEYKNFAILEDEIDMILSAMGVEHVVECRGNSVTALFEVEDVKEGMSIKRHLDAVLS